ncbi:MAG TPA: roadblock/LC7 domain-containing protein [Desulfuromonadaceae bacterium]|jgi:predicted regulator of Ras-like GTPase activity (Roadblock/LC7/MglB family)
MQTVLQSLHSVPGIIGGVLSDDDGSVLAHSFPSVFDLSALQGICNNLNFNVMGLQEASGGVKLLDLRFEHGRVIVKTMPNLFLLLLCEQTVNLQLLFISINVAVKKLEKIYALNPLTPLAAPPTAQLIASTLAGPKLRTDNKGCVILSSHILPKTGYTFWESMTESAALVRSTAIEISNHFKIGDFKKLTLTNRLTGKSCVTPVQIMTHDKEGKYDGKVVLTLAVAEQLQANEGDLLSAEVVIGGGLFGWEGI